MRLFTLGAVAAALAATAGAGASSSATLVTGTVVLDPATPVCSVRRPCTKYIPYFKLAFWHSGKLAARTRTNSRGHYRVSLSPGTYRVTHTPQGPGAGLTPKRVSIPATKSVVRRFHYDAGIR